jgi:hypothetical protein
VDVVTVIFVLDLTKNLNVKTFMVSAVGKDEESGEN